MLDVHEPPNFPLIPNSLRCLAILFPDQPEDKMFECTCFPDKPRKFKKRVKYIRNKEKRYDVGLLNWKKTLNPIVRVDGPTFHGSARQQKQTAMEFEQFLGETLRLAGHAVYWN